MNRRAFTATVATREIARAERMQVKRNAGPVSQFHGRVGTLALAIAALSFALLRAEPAAAQYSRDRVAERDIAKAISRHYLAMRFDAAEKQLLGVIKSCKRKCRPQTIAKAWMYVGIVRGSGKEDLDAAGDAFDTAFTIDPQVALDDALATGETQTAFRAALDARGGNTQPVPLIAAPSSTTEAAPRPPEAPQPSSALSCTPSARDVQTRRPIPIECRGDEEEVRFTLRYKLPGESSWKTLEMKRRGASFRAQIPCESTMTAGNVDFYVVASDGSGTAVETFGSKSAPEHFVVDATSEAAPAYEGEPPPARCEERVLCPPDFPGCEDSMGDESNDADADRAPSYERNRIGLHFAADFGFIQGSNVCATSNESFECFTSGADTPYPAELPASIASQPGELGDPYPGTGIQSGASGGTLRALFSYDRAFSQRISAGLRLGYAFGGAPSSLDGRSFLPVHAEGRLQYWFRGLGAKGLQPYLNVGGGIAQVDIEKTGVTVRDCSEEPARQAFLDCIDARNAYDSGNDPVLPTRTLDAYRKLGKAFASAGAGVLVPLGGNVDVQVNLNAMLMFPSVGLVLQPSIGLGYSL